MLFWQSQYGFQICAMLSLGTMMGFYVMGPVTNSLLLPRAAHVFQLERSDGVCHPWQFVLHSYSTMVARMVVPFSLGFIASWFMVVPIVIPASDLALAILHGLLVVAWVISFAVLLVCAVPDSAIEVMSASTMVAVGFEGFLVPRAGMPVILQWLTYFDPVFWGFASVVQVLLKDRQLPCKKESTLSCLEHDQNSLIVHFGLQVVNRWTGMVVLISLTWLCLLLAIASFLPWTRYRDTLKKRFFQRSKLFSIESSLLSGSLPIKFSSLSPTKIEQLTTGSGEKTQCSPAGVRSPAGLRCVFLSDPAVSSSIFVGERKRI